ncbi:hypothetical protein CYMTET_34018 [Cymbomonas tetramitiformis]|uniref:Uncharacterized protein n=1 Tax=Cymbomonas tetramitiformis TaxID=36881 RepID=A0AAE0FC05_9CHLO|nr:hypothetical protein CYMTET_34018 [Cymbomonas tetramitiformis]|eukprot:gene7862-9337_t
MMRKRRAEKKKPTEQTVAAAVVLNDDAVWEVENLEEVFAACAAKSDAPVVRDDGEILHPSWIHGVYEEEYGESKVCGKVTEPTVSMVDDEVLVECSDEPSDRVLHFDTMATQSILNDVN